MTSSTLQSNPPCSESRLRSRSLGMGPLLLRAPISCDIICDGVGVPLSDADDAAELLSPCASAARNRPLPPLPPLLPLLLLPLNRQPLTSSELLVDRLMMPLVAPLNPRLLLLLLQLLPSAVAYPCPGGDNSEGDRPCHSFIYFFFLWSISFSILLEFLSIQLFYSFHFQMN